MKLTFSAVGLLLHLDSCAAKIGILAQMIHDGPANADTGIAGESSAFAQRIVLCGGHQPVITNLDQVLYFRGCMHAAAHMPGYLAYQLHMASNQLFNIRFLFEVLVSHGHGPAGAASMSAKKRMPA